MSRWLWFLLILVICMPVAFLAFGYELPQWNARKAKPLSVPTGDIEMAWMHTSTNGTTWERFVTGLKRISQKMPDITVSDADAYSESPEVVLSRAGRPGKLRIRWYKLTSEQNHADWVAALMQRDPPPIAMIGGGSSDRAADLALALKEHSGDPSRHPLLFITTATSNNSRNSPLLEVYSGHSFRFCFTNRQMAQAVVNFAQTSKMLPASGGASPKFVSVVWGDDPYSDDLHNDFAQALEKYPAPTRYDVPFSIGGQNSTNLYESKVAEAIAADCRDKNQPVVLLLCSVTQTARRLLLELLSREPSLRDRLTVLTGDGIPMNAILRDGEFAWPVRSLPVPLVFFCHNDPVAWEAKPSPLQQPNSTEDLLHFKDIGEKLAQAVFESDAGMPTQPEELHRRLSSLKPKFFQASGERESGTGEYVVVLRGDAKLEVFKRNLKGWDRTALFMIDQDQRRALPLAGGER
jgi:hypothetical protein